MRARMSLQYIQRNIKKSDETFGIEHIPARSRGGVVRRGVKGVSRRGRSGGTAAQHLANARAERYYVGRCRYSKLPPPS